MYSNGQGFYLTLPSESSKGLFPENNASEYSVRLPHWIHLKGNWEIGLHSIAYTRRNIIIISTEQYYMDILSMMEQRHWQQQEKCRNITFQRVNTYQTSTHC